MDLKGAGFQQAVRQLQLVPAEDHPFRSAQRKPFRDPCKARRLAIANNVPDPFRSGSPTPVSRGRSRVARYRDIAITVAELSFQHRR